MRLPSLSIHHARKLTGIPLTSPKLAKLLLDVENGNHSAELNFTVAEGTIIGNKHADKAREMNEQIAAARRWLYETRGLYLAGEVKAYATPTVFMLIWRHATQMDYICNLSVRQPNKCEAAHALTGKELIEEVAEFALDVHEKRLQAGDVTALTEMFDSHSGYRQEKYQKDVKHLRAWLIKEHGLYLHMNKFSVHVPERQSAGDFQKLKDHHDAGMVGYALGLSLEQDQHPFVTEDGTRLTDFQSIGAKVTGLKCQNWRAALLSIKLLKGYVHSEDELLWEEGIEDTEDLINWAQKTLGITIKYEPSKKEPGPGRSFSIKPARLVVC